MATAQPSHTRLSSSTPLPARASTRRVPTLLLAQRLRQARQHLQLAALLLVLLLLCKPASGIAGEAAQPPICAEDRVCSPYFVLPSGDPSIDALPLKSTDVQVAISGMIAEVTVKQTYRNEGRRTLEARYVFPGSSQSAVHALQMRLGNRIVRAQIREKQQAQQAYEQAKAEGKTAALLEQHRPNVFEMNLANILPGDEVQVELQYTELLVPTDGQYDFVFPTVVGPRYNSPDALQADSGGSDQAFSQAISAPADSAAATPKFDLQVQLNAPMPLARVTSPSHAIATAYADHDSRALVRLAHQATPANNRDFVLHYQLAGRSIASGVLLYEGAQAGDDNYFLAMVEPPKTVTQADITPRDYIFVVDISGSMNGFPLDTAKTMLRELIGGLRPSDTFNVMLFSGNNVMLSPQSVPATKANIQQALKTIDLSYGSGSTELIPALRKAIAMPKADNTSRSIIVVTDGYVSVESEAYALVRNNLHRANLFAFGIGSSVNRHLIDSLARAGMGEPFVITNPDQAREQAQRFRAMVEQPVLTHLQARFEGIEAYDLVPAQIPDVMAQRPVVVMGKWRASQPGTPAGQLVLSGYSANGAYSSTLPFSQSLSMPSPLANASGGATADDNPSNTVLRLLWARQQIASLSDEEALIGGNAQRDAITQLGLDYSLLTQYTSFLAVDERVRSNDPADAVSVNQPNPLPEGVSSLAVGGQAVPSTPEAGTLGSLVLVTSLIAVLARHRKRQQRRRYTR
ncbi:VWA domain-containing protein [Lampropedia aestuarii]|uniref:VWA domain-containing protein n=1 Tax=Lampropedia aestuarii TaxID=2562762 RepID=A0A4S5BH87_9BURK|nr:VIT and VWA domain-containing protein [Lampropedia aestuarii]THJ31747.1 VWA domain-containing protein [Lampropedia aestuarii]